MGKADLYFKTAEGLCSFRVRAIIMDAQKILMAKHARGYYYPIGGRVHMGESSVDAVLREVQEETGVTMEIDRIGFLHENFYFDDKRGMNTHELALYYYMKPIPLLSKRRLFGSSGLELCWLPIESLAGERLFPTFFKTRLLEPSEHFEHIFTWED